MNVLIACEFSGIVRDAFLARGHNAMSCDLLPTEKEGPHYRGDVRDILCDYWDLMICHPPCTYLSVAGLQYCVGNPTRQRKRLEAFSFVLELFYSGVQKVCIENPVGYLSTAWQKPTQIVYMNWFGHNARKPTCLWLKNLPKLDATNIVGYDTVAYPNGRVMSSWYASTKGDKRRRSLTFWGLADAMATQWG